eukprot:501193-Pyramimonas_sp.AAC.1
MQSDGLGGIVTRERRRGGAGELIRQVLDEQYMAAPSSFGQREEPTYYASGSDGRQGGCSTIDYFYVPQ